LRPDAVRAHLARDPRLIIPIGTTEQHGPHLPLGADTILVERLAGELSAEFGVLLAPTVEYGVNAKTRTPYPGNATVRRKTLHRFMNDLVGSWEEGGVEGFVILTAHGHDPHQEALSTLRTRRASIRTVDIFSTRLEGEVADFPIHGGLVDTSLLLYIDQDLVDLPAAADFPLSPKGLRRWRRTGAGVVPPEGPGSLGRPTQASIEMGARLYHLIYQRIASRIFERPGPP
jgi:creatinine amidohydrolase